MADNRPVHVIHRDDVWAVEREGASRASSVGHATQAVAADTARETARREHAERIVHGLTGRSAGGTATATTRSLRAADRRDASQNCPRTRHARREPDVTPRNLGSAVLRPPHQTTFLPRAPCATRSSSPTRNLRRQRELPPDQVRGRSPGQDCCRLLRRTRRGTEARPGCRCSCQGDPRHDRRAAHGRRLVRRQLAARLVRPEDDVPAAQGRRPRRRPPRVVEAPA